MSASDLAQVVERSHRALDAFVDGDPEPFKRLYARDGDVTLANPYGPPARGWAEVEPTLDRAARNYRDGEAVGFDHVAGYATDDLAYLVEIERFRSKVGGADAATPFSLRVTTVFRRGDGPDGTWKIVHRHADPITAPRSAASVLGG